MAELEASFLHAPADVTGQDLRTAAFADLQEGVFGSGDLKVTPGAGLTLDVAAGVALVQGDSITEQGRYYVRNDAAKNSAAFALGGIAPAHATLPRLDQIVARVYDHEADGLGLRTWRLEVVAGTATAGATLDNRNGAAALPASAVRLADVLVPAAFAGPFVAATHLRDRRQWAQGARFSQLQIAGADYSVASTSFAELDATNLKTRIECSGKPLRVRFTAEFVASAAANHVGVVRPTIDGVTGVGSEGAVSVGSTGSSGFGPLETEWVLSPSVGSHLIAIQAKVNFAGTAVFNRGTDYTIGWEIEEDLRVSASNA